MILEEFNKLSDYKFLKDSFLRWNRLGLSSILDKSGNMKKPELSKAMVGPNYLYSQTLRVSPWYQFRITD